jgi:hypothetical protein
MEIHEVVPVFAASTHRQATTYTDTPDPEHDRIVRVWDVEPITIEEARASRQAERRLQTAQRLTPTDGYVIRATDPTGGAAIPDWALAERQAIRDASSQRAAWLDDPARGLADFLSMDGCPGWPA